MFWDSSALVPILLPEAQSATAERLARSEKELVIWWATPVECHSALYRRLRGGALSATLVEPAARRLALVLRDADIIAATDEVRDRARRLVSLHPLRAADAFQLAAALTWCREQPFEENFVCLDDRLREAAQKEGFRLLPAA